jgi:hypothetical protein
VTGGDGKKPTITKDAPVFDEIYKNAVLELKRQIYFVNAFPTPAELDNLPRKVYNQGVAFVNESKLFHQDKFQGIDRVFDGKWVSCVCTLVEYLVSTTDYISCSYSIKLVRFGPS